MNIILFGIKGCGKTTFGKKIASKLNRAFIDTDTLVEDLYHIHCGRRMSCSNIFLEVGSAGFRALEYEVIQSLQDVQHSVIAVGGSAMISIENVEALMKSGALFHLVYEKEPLKKRVLSGEELPAFLDPNDPENSFNKMYDERSEFYHRLNAHEIDVTYMKDRDVVDTICNKFERDRGKKERHGK